MGELLANVDWDVGEAERVPYTTDDVERLVTAAKNCVLPVALSRPRDEAALAIARELKAALLPFTQPEANE